MKKIVLTLLTGSMLFFSACDEETLLENLDANIDTGKAYILGETSFFDVFKIIDKAVRDTSLLASGSVVLDGAQLSLLPGDSGVLVDYGPNNVNCPDGKQRRGSIRVLVDGDYMAYTADLAISLLDFYQNDDHIEGTQTISGSITKSNYDVEMQVSNGKITQANGKILNWETTRTLRWLQGMLTPEDISDDRIAILDGSQVTGNVEGGNTFAVEVINALEYGRDCEWISKGFLNITIPGLPVETGSVDFGNGDCDAKVMLIFGGSSIPYMMN